MNYPSSSNSPVDTALSLACLSEYAHTLDSLPMDLSRSYGDLRELDAVLSSSMALLTTKINDLISMIENKTGTNDERLYLLAEISEEASRLKLGGEDKIRVACHAADGLRSHKTHMRALLDRIPDAAFSRAAEQLGKKTVYPHVTSKHFYPPGMTGEGGRRNRRAAGAGASYGGLLLNGAEPSPEKKKRRVQRDDDDDVTRTPSKKERLDGAPPQRQRNGARAKKYVFIRLWSRIIFPHVLHYTLSLSLLSWGLRVGWALIEMAPDATGGSIAHSSVHYCLSFPLIAALCGPGLLLSPPPHPLSFHLT